MTIKKSPKSTKATQEDSKQQNLEQPLPAWKTLPQCQVASKDELRVDVDSTVTPEEYLEFEKNSEFKHEYFDGEMFDMVGARRNHNIIRSNITGELRKYIIYLSHFLFFLAQSVNLN